MKVIKPSYEIINEPDWNEVLLQLEKAIRTCYKSEKNITIDSAEKKIREIITNSHESTLEHRSLSVRFICDRGVSHELVRHRHCSFSQESTRYVNYKGREMEFILPCWLDDSYLGSYELMDVWNKIDRSDKATADLDWIAACCAAELSYNKLILQGWKAQQARSVLPNSLKTEILVTTNLRDWRHIFHLRCDKAAHPQMRELMLPLYEELKTKCPVIFDSVKFNI